MFHFRLYIHIYHRQIAKNIADQHYLKLDCAFSSMMNSFLSINPQAQDHIKILWFKYFYVFGFLKNFFLNYFFWYFYSSYFLIILEIPYSKNHFNVIYENLRHICLNFNNTDPIFVYHLINSISQLINAKDRFNFLTELCKLIPDNVNLVLNICDLMLREKKKEKLWNLILYIIYEKKIRFQYFQFWKMYFLFFV